MLVYIKLFLSYFTELLLFRNCVDAQNDLTATGNESVCSLLRKTNRHPLLVMVKKCFVFSTVYILFALHNMDF